MMKRSAFTRTLASVLTLVMLLALAVGFCACAREKDDGITPLTVTEENRHLVGFTGAVGEELVIPETIEVDGRQYRITVIDDYAFYDCINLISVTLPESVMQIGSYAFYSCFALKSIVLPEGIECIEPYAFDECVMLESVVIPKSVKHIEKSAFEDCLSLKTVYYCGNEAAWGRVGVEEGNHAVEHATVLCYREHKPLLGGEGYWHFSDGVPTAW